MRRRSAQPRLWNTAFPRQTSGETAQETALTWALVDLSEADGLCSVRARPHEDKQRGRSKRCGPQDPLPGDTGPRADP